MSFAVLWTKDAERTFLELQDAAEKAIAARSKSGETKTTKAEGLFKQVVKCVELLTSNPRHPGLRTHEYDALINPYDKDAKVFEAYVQNRTPGAYRLFWCYGKGKGQITILAITPHP